MSARTSILSLAAASLALSIASPAAAQQYRHPSTCQSGCMTVTAYYDYAGAGATRDWNCGAQTYDGHRGTDFGTYGSWAAVDEGREVVAAADGDVIASHDGEFDRCTTGSCAGGGGFGNYVAVRHADGKVTYYGHMRRGSVTVGVGARVTCGTRLGMIASSGYSTGPHLHFEPRIGGTSADDPFGMGGCSGPLTYWVSQGAYRALPGTTCEATEPPPTDGASVASIEPAAGTHVAPASDVTVRIVMRNSGTTTWRDGDMHLLTFDGGERMDAPEQIPVGADVAPGAERAFDLTLRAPTTPGEHAASFRMDRYGTARFGDVAEVRIVVDEWPDADGDGARADVDCDDADGTRAPGASEICDGADQDCDDAIDEGLSCEAQPDGGAPAGDAATTPARDGAAPGARDGGTSPGGRDGALVGGCAIATGRAGHGAPLTIALVLAIALALRRRRASPAPSSIRGAGRATIAAMRALTLLSLALAITACTAGSPALPPTDPEAIPEASVTGASITADWERSGAHLVAPALDAETGATRIGLLVVLDGASSSLPRIEVRGVRADGTPGPWSALETTFEEPDQAVQRIDLDFVATRAELRVAAADAARIATLTWSALVPPPSIATELDPADVGLARAPLRDDLRAMGVRDRASWGARATRCTSRDPDKYRIAIHHTVTPSGGDIPARLRGIQAYHMDSNGWCDVGYHFLVSLDGTLWEGRDLELLGTHVGSNNTGNVGISYIGCFHSSGCSTYTPFMPPDVMVESGARLAGAIARIYGITVSPTSLKGHRDHTGQTTSCPGDHLHGQLDRIRMIASSPTTPRFRAVYVEQTFPLARDPFELAPGEIVAGHISMRNEGTETWTPGATFLGTTEPRDVASPIAAPDWVAPNRPATVDRVVAPGEVGTFAFSVRAPDALGDYPQFFSLVQEGVAWFSDPGEGGPPDDLLQVRVTTIPAPEVDAGPIAETDAGPIAMPDASTVAPVDAGPLADAGVGGGREPVGGCGCTVAPRRGAGPLAIALLGLLAFAAHRRRRAPRR